MAEYFYFRRVRDSHRRETFDRAFHLGASAHHAVREKTGCHAIRGVFITANTVISSDELVVTDADASSSRHQNNRRGDRKSRLSSLISTETTDSKYPFVIQIAVYGRPFLTFGRKNVFLRQRTPEKGRTTERQFP